MHLIESGRIVSRLAFCAPIQRKTYCERVASTSSQGTKKYYSIKSIIGIRAGGGRGEGRGGLQPPPNFVQLRCFWAARKNLGRTSFKDVSMSFFNYYFEEINIFYLNLKSAQ